MQSEIKKLAKKASVLEPAEVERKKLTQLVADYVENFLSHLPASQIFEADLINLKSLHALGVEEKPKNIDEIIHLIKDHVIDPGLNLSAPGFLGYIPGGALFSAALGDFIAAATNRYAGIHFVSPGATRLENILVEWLCQLLGYSKQAGGYLASGGSLANFTAIVAARETFALSSKDFHRAVVYTSSQVHHSMIKGLRIAGLKETIIRYIPVDENYCVKPELLLQNIQQDKKNKLIPWLIIGNLGTTNTGSVDPSKQLAEIASSHHLWLHMDAAYGGFFILCDTLRPLFQGIEKADSITIDPHKGLFMPFGLGALLMKDKHHLLKTYHYDEIDYIPNYQFEYESSPASMSPELSRHFRGLRLWLPLKLYGVAPFRAALQEKLLLTQYFYEALTKMSGIEIACRPQLSVVAFRFHPKAGNINEFNTRLAEAIKIQGKIFFSTTYLNKQLYLRMACLNFRTHLDTIQEALLVLKETINTLSKL